MIVASFNKNIGTPATTATNGALQTSGVTVTHEGAQGETFDEKTELFLACVGGFVNEKSFYEGADQRLNRVQVLAAKITKSDPEWMERFIAWLRGPSANIRTASIVCAAEYAAAGGPNIRKVIDSALQRADEPAELLAYWINFYGYLHLPKITFPAGSPRIPNGILRGVGDAVRRLWNERSVLKYNSAKGGVSMADVLNLTHVKPIDDHQRKLFGYVIDKHYGNAHSNEQLNALPVIHNNMSMWMMPQHLRPEVVKASNTVSDALYKAGFTWESFSGWLGGEMDAKAWEAIIPSMRYMALLRNLRNFEQAGVSTAVKDQIIVKLTDPTEVAESRQLPFRFYSAHREMGSTYFLDALEKGLQLSLKNLPTFYGRTMVMIDVSGSMDEKISSRSVVSVRDVGQLFAGALSLANPANTDVVLFGTNSTKLNLAEDVTLLQAMGALDTINRGVASYGLPRRGDETNLGHSTHAGAALAKHYNGHERVVIFTDGQFSDDLPSVGVPFIHTFLLGGYGRAARMPEVDNPARGRYRYGGFSDATFKLMGVQEMIHTSWDDVFGS